MFINICIALLRHYRIWKWTTWKVTELRRRTYMITAVAYRENIEVTLSCVRDTPLAESWKPCAYVKILTGTVKEHEALHTHALFYWLSIEQYPAPIVLFLPHERYVNIFYTWLASLMKQYKFGQIFPSM